MMIDPPIDKLVEKVGCKYALVGLVSKRAKQLIEVKQGELEASGERAITLASYEVYKDEVVAKIEE